MLPSKKVQQCHGCRQTNPLGVDVILHFCVATFDKDAAIAFTLHLDMKHHNNADTDILNGLMD